MIMKNEMYKEEINADKLSELWDEGCENDIIDPGDLFEKTINYCYKLESKIARTSFTNQKGNEDIIKDYVPTIVKLVLNKTHAPENEKELIEFCQEIAKGVLNQADNLSK